MPCLLEPRYRECQLPETLSLTFPYRRAPAISAAVKANHSAIFVTVKLKFAVSLAIMNTNAAPQPKDPGLLTQPERLAHIGVSVPPINLYNVDSVFTLAATLPFLIQPWNRHD